MIVFVNFSACHCLVFKMFFQNLTWFFYKYKQKLVDNRKWSSGSTCLPLKVLFFGTDTFSLPSLQMLRENTKYAFPIIIYLLNIAQTNLEFFNMLFKVSFKFRCSNFYEKSR